MITPLKEMSEEQYKIIELISGVEDFPTVILRESYWNSWEWKDKEYSLQKTAYWDWVIWFTELIRDLSWISYNKFWTDNLFIVRWNGFKDPDIATLVYELGSNQELDTKEKINNYQLIAKLAKEKIKELKK